jgi:ABC-type multidrug transport system ATPase subunit
LAVGIRTQDLRKVYNSAPPLGAAGGFIARTDAKGGKQPKVQIAALDGLSLEVEPGEIFCLLGPNGAGQVHNRRRSDHACASHWREGVDW